MRKGGVEKGGERWGVRDYIIQVKNTVQLYVEASGVTRLCLILCVMLLCARVLCVPVL